MFVSDATSICPNMTAPDPVAPPLLADMPTLVGTWDDLSAFRRRDLRSALSATARICAAPNLDCDPDDTPAPLPVMSCAYLNTRLFRQVPAAHGISEATFANIVSQLRFALRRLGGHEPLAFERAALQPAWQHLHKALTPHRQMALSSFMRFCDAQDIDPKAVPDHALEDFQTWRRQHTLCDDVPGRAQAVASNWTWARAHVPGWPDVALERPGMLQRYTFPFTDYPASLQADVARFLDRLACGDAGDIFPDGADDAHGPRSGLRPLRPRTIKGREHQMRQCLAAMVIGGRDPATITSLRDLVDPPEQAKAILAFFITRAGNKATTQTRAIGEVLCQVARLHCQLDAAVVDKIKWWAKRARPKQQVCISEKNMRRLQALLQPRKRLALLNLPLVLMREAADEQLQPRDAALLAMYGIALDILLVFPMRRANLAALHLDRHLQSSSTKSGLVDYITLAKDETKTEKAMLWPLPVDVATRLEVYLKRHRPHLATFSNRYLFPDTGTGGRSAHDMAVYMTELVERRTGCEFNLHLIRHFVVALFLERHPGQYDTARLLLGHAKSSYTIAVYDGLGAMAAARQLDVVLTHERGAAAILPPRPARKRPGQPRKPGQGG